MKRKQKSRERLVKLVELVLFPIGVLILLFSYGPVGGWLVSNHPGYFLTMGGSVYAEPVFLCFYVILLALSAALFVSSLRYFIKQRRGAQSK